MRFLIYSVFVVGWMSMWWWIYLYHIKDCDNIYGTESELRAKYDPRTPFPLSFAWSDPTPILSPGFEKWRDSIAASLRSDQVLHLTALAYRDESPSGNTAELSTRRMRAIARLFGIRLQSSRILANADVGQLTEDIRNRHFPAYRLEVLTQNDDLYETGSCTLLRFAYDSVQQAQNSILGPYLRQLSDTLAMSNGVIALQAFEEQTQKQAEQTEQAELRLSILRQLLIVYGIEASRIVLLDPGEQIPYSCLPPQWDRDFRDWIVIRFLN